MVVVAHTLGLYLGIIVKKTCCLLTCFNGHTYKTANIKIHAWFLIATLRRLNVTEILQSEACLYFEPAASLPNPQ
jgi:hypothetical protein